MRFENIPLGHSFMFGGNYCIKIGPGLKSFKDEYARDNCCNAIDLHNMHLVTYCNRCEHIKDLGANKRDLLSAYKLLQSDKAKSQLCDSSLLHSKYVVTHMLRCIEDDEIAEGELEAEAEREIKREQEALTDEIRKSAEAAKCRINVDSAFSAIAFLSDTINKASTLNIPPQAQSTESRRYLDKTRIETIRRTASDILNICDKFVEPHE